MLRILHTNDLHGALTDAKEHRLANLREDADLYFDCGDASGKTRLRDLDAEDPVWGRLAQLRCDALTLGNHEIVGMMLARRSDVRGLATPLVLANAGGVLGASPSLVIEVAGQKVGVVGVTTPRLHPSGRPLRRLNQAFGAAIDWTSDAVFGRFGLTDPIAAARREVARLRGEVDTIIVLSHLGIRGDLLLATISGVDVILGAHSHHERAPARLGGVAYAQNRDGAETAGSYVWNGETLTGELVPL